jgi:hypothetical protein
MTNTYRKKADTKPRQGHTHQLPISRLGPFLTKKGNRIDTTLAGSTETRQPTGALCSQVHKVNLRVYKEKKEG